MAETKIKIVCFIDAAVNFLSLDKKELQTKQMKLDEKPWAQWDAEMQMLESTHW